LVAGFPMRVSLSHTHTYTHTYTHTNPANESRITLKKSGL